MSNSTGAIKFTDGEIRYYEYNGCANVVASHHYKTVEEVVKNWREHIWVNCKCGAEEPVSIYANSGFGFYTEGYACKKCNSVRTKDINEYGDFTYIHRSKTDDWAKEIFK